MTSDDAQLIAKSLEALRQVVFTGLAAAAKSSMGAGLDDPIWEQFHTADDQFNAFIAQIRTGGQ